MASCGVLKPGPLLPRTGDVRTAPAVGRRQRCEQPRGAGVQHRRRLVGCAATATATATATAAGEGVGLGGRRRTQRRRRGAACPAAGVKPMGLTVTVTVTVPFVGVTVAPPAQCGHGVATPEHAQRPTRRKRRQLTRRRRLERWRVWWRAAWLLRLRTVLPHHIHRHVQQRVLRRHRAKQRQPPQPPPAPAAGPSKTCQTTRRPPARTAQWPPRAAGARLAASAVPAAAAGGAWLRVLGTGGHHRVHSRSTAPQRRLGHGNNGRTVKHVVQSNVVGAKAKVVAPHAAAGHARRRRWGAHFLHGRLLRTAVHAVGEVQ